jgi:hypothetical protein
MKKYLPLILLLTLPLPLQASYFNVAVTQTNTSACDTAIVTWDGYPFQDSLAVWYDLNSYPDADSIGRFLYASSWASGVRVKVCHKLPAGDYVYFALLGRLNGAWSQLGTDSVYVPNYARAFPRVGTYFHGVTINTQAEADSVAALDLVVGSKANIFYPAWGPLEGPGWSDSLKQRNPEILRISHHYIADWEAHWGRGGIERDLAAVALSDTIIHFFVNEDSLILGVAQRLKLAEALTPGESNITLSDTLILNGTDWTTHGADDQLPYLMIVEQNWAGGGANNYEFVRLEQCYPSGDSINVTRDQGSNNETWDTNDSLYVIDSRYIHKSNPAEIHSGGKMYFNLPAPYSSYAGWWLINLKARLEVEEIDTDRVGGDPVVEGTMYDVFFKDHAAHRPADTTWVPEPYYELGDSTLWHAQNMMRIMYDSLGMSGLHTSANMRWTSMTGVEELVSAPLLAEAGIYNDDIRYQDGKDLVFNERIAMWELTQYRYGMRSDNWPPHILLDDYDSSSPSNWRKSAALMTIYGGVSSNKTLMGAARWADEFWVDDNGDVTFGDANSAAFTDGSRWWLGWPTRPRKYLLSALAAAPPDTFIASGTFESGASGWSASDTGSISIYASTLAAHSGDSGLVIASKMTFDDTLRLRNNANTQSQADLYTGVSNNGAYVKYATLPDLAHQGEYTLHFWARTGGVGEINQSREIGVQLNTGGRLWETIVHVPHTWKEFYLPIYADSTLNEWGTAPDYVGGEIWLGLTPVVRGMKADTIYIDDVEMYTGNGLVGLGREFENGYVVYNPTHSSVKVDLPGADSTYQKILGNAAYGWSDPTHNDGGIIADSLTITAGEAYFLYKRTDGPIQDIHPHPAPSSITLTSPSPSVIEIVFPQSTEGDCAGYVSRYFEGENNAPGHYQEGFIGDSTAVSDTTHTLTGLTPGTWYSVSIFEFDTLGNYSDTTSN